MATRWFSVGLSSSTVPSSICSAAETRASAISARVRASSILLRGENPGVYAGSESDNSSTPLVQQQDGYLSNIGGVVRRTPRRFHRHLNAQYRDSGTQHVRDTHLEPLWCLGSDNSESHTGIGVTAVWPRHRLVMPTGREPANIPTQRCGAVGSLAVHGEEEVTSRCPGESRKARETWFEACIEFPGEIIHLFKRPGNEVRRGRRKNARGRSRPNRRTHLFNPSLRHPVGCDLSRREDSIQRTRSNEVRPPFTETSTLRVLQQALLPARIG